MRGRWRPPISSAVGAFCVVALVTLAVTYTSDHASAGGSPAASSSTTTTLDTPTTSFYLAIGASASLGIQPTGILSNNGAPTKWGYANDLVRLEAARGTNLTLHKIGCMGETAESMVGAGDHCYKLPATQLSTALDFLRAHRSATGVVTIDIGFNDIRPCLWVVPIAGQCANNGISNVRRDMPRILSALKSAAGAHVHFVGLEYADPWLSNFLPTQSGSSVATQSLSWVTQMNDALSSAYAAAGVPVAQIAAAFQSGDTTPTTTNDGVVPLEVARVCQWTWMCHTTPWGPDDHPNDAGYRGHRPGGYGGAAPRPLVAPVSEGGRPRGPPGAGRG